MDALLRGRDARAAREVRPHRLVAPGLLRQVRDGAGRRHRPAVRLLEAGEHAQQRRLADAVRAHEADPRARRHDEVDVGQDDGRTMELGDAVGGEQRDLLTRRDEAER